MSKVFFTAEDFDAQCNCPDCPGHITVAHIANAKVAPLLKLVEDQADLTSRMKDRVDVLEAENAHLKEELAELEGACLEPLRKENAQLHLEVDKKVRTNKVQIAVNIKLAEQKLKLRKALQFYAEVEKHLEETYQGVDWHNVWNCLCDAGSRARNALSAVEAISADREKAP